MLAKNFESFCSHSGRKFLRTISPYNLPDRPVVLYNLWYLPTNTVYDLETYAVLYPANFRIRRPTPAAAAAATTARPAVPVPRDIGGSGDDAAPLAARALLLGRLGAAAAQVEHAGAEGRRGARAEPIPGGDIHDDAAVPPSAAAAALREIRGGRHGVEEK